MVEINDILADAEKIMKRCQIGTPRLDIAHDILADCYGTIGRLRLIIETHNRDMNQTCDSSDCYGQYCDRFCPDCPKHYRIE